MPGTPENPARIEILHGSRRGQTQELPIPGTYRIGCQEGCEIRFDPNQEPFVSGNHARLILNRGSACLEDLGSSNGTYLNGQLIAEERRLYCGDNVEFGFGGPRFRFEGKGQCYHRELAGRSTVIIPKRETAPRKGGHTPAATTTKPQRISPVTGAVLCVLLIALAAAFFYRRDLLSLQKELHDARAAPPRQPIATTGDSLTRRYGRATYLIALRVIKEGFRVRRGEVPVGYLHPGGSAWAFDPKGRLATNAHVMQSAEQLVKEHSPFLELVAVQNETGDIYPITGCRIHPGAVENNPDDMAYLISDVAIINVSKALPVVMPLASREAALKVSPGQAVYSLGFPIEHFGPMQQFYGYDSPDRVVATLRQGLVQRVTSADGRRSDPQHDRLVHIGIAATGGQSGSPVFTGEGEVVSILNATAQYKLSSSTPGLPHPGLFTYSVRIDALHDMLEDKAEGPDRQKR